MPIGGKSKGRRTRKELQEGWDIMRGESKEKTPRGTKARGKTKKEKTRLRESKREEKN